MANVNLLTGDDVTIAYNRIKNYIHLTPLLTSQYLNSSLGANIFVKFEGMQKVGAFKARGALNTLLALKEKGNLPAEVVAYSSGNHAQAVAWAANLLNIKATIIIPESASKVKIAATKAYGADVILTKERQEAEELAQKKSQNAFLLPPYDHDDVIAGQGTSALEAWRQEGNFDAVFAPCGGGGLLSGTYLASRLFSPTCKIFACEPEIANDASRSYKSGKIERYSTSPMTIADGTRTLSVSERTFQYIKQLDGFFEIPEEKIIYWTQWMSHLYKINVEPTSALGLAGAYEWLKTQKNKPKILIIASGGNLDVNTYQKIWAIDNLIHPPGQKKI